VSEEKRYRTTLINGGARVWDTKDKKYIAFSAFNGHVEMICKALNKSSASNKSDVDRFAEILPVQDKAFEEALNPTPASTELVEEIKRSLEVSEAFNTRNNEAVEGKYLGLEMESLLKRCLSALSASNKGKAEEEILEVVEEQACDEGLWCDAVYASEAYIQKALRRLHKVIEETK